MVSYEADFLDLLQRKTLISPLQLVKFFRIAPENNFPLSATMRFSKINYAHFILLIIHSFNFVLDSLFDVHNFANIVHFRL